MSRSDRADPSGTLTRVRTAGLLRHQDELQARAGEVVQDLQLRSILSACGEVMEVGSAAMGLMVARDIGIAVRCETWTIEHVFAAGRMIAEHPRVFRMDFVNEAGPFTPAGLNPGYYWGVHYHDTDGAEWKLDLWFWPPASPVDDLQHVRDICARLSPEARMAILWIKDGLRDRPGYRSLDIYEAVLDRGVRSPGEYADDRRRREPDNA